MTHQEIIKKAQKRLVDARKRYEAASNLNEDSDKVANVYLAAIKANNAAVYTVAQDAFDAIKANNTAVHTAAQNAFDDAQQRYWDAIEKALEAHAAP